MKFHPAIGSARTFGLAIALLLLTACIPSQHKNTQPLQEFSVSTKPHPGSAFNIATADFQVRKSRHETMMFLSDTRRIPQWMAYVEQVTLVDYIDHNNFVIRAELDLPWPVQNRELIACVTTRFEQELSVIDMHHCPDRVPSSKTLPIKGLNAQWRLHSEPGGHTRISYSTWIDLGGLIPAFGFNLLLPQTTRNSLEQLRQLIHASGTNHAY